MQSTPLPPILTIAGSDSGGGAGIQADLKTIQALGGYGASAITALTAQNTRGVDAIFPVAEAFLAQQIHAVLSDIGAAAIKTGMLANAEIIGATARALTHHHAANAPRPQAPLVVDPVVVAKGGASLLTSDALTALKQQLLPLATLVTPNIPEAQLLGDCTITSLEEMQAAAIKLLALGPKAALVKGGHLDSGDLVYNVLATASGQRHTLTSPRINTPNTHGTGCTLSAAIATYLGLGHPLIEACAKAEAYVAGAIAHAPTIGSGHGPLHHNWVNLTLE